MAYRGFGGVELTWQYVVYFVAGAALLAFFARRRRTGGSRGTGLIGLAIFIVLGMLLLFGALDRTG